MSIVDFLAQDAWEKCKPFVKYAYSFDRYSEKNESLKSTIKGIYFFTEKGVEPSPGNCIYVGETYSKQKYNGISSRVRNHKKSLIDPAWKVEHTGKKFLKAKIDLDIEMDLWYIDACDVGINDKQSARSVEQLIQKHLKPVVWDII
jgi:hypothetical protein